jgi:hypothetical protein
MMNKTIAGACAVLALALTMKDATAQQSRESAVNDATASQWSLQFAYQAMPSYRSDTLVTGDVRSEGNKGFFQYRMVAPIPVGKIKILPRLTIRYTENAAGEWGLSPTDVFALIVPWDWGTGRAGLGPDIVIPGSSKVGSSEWSYGVAGAVIQRFLNDKLMVGLLVQQVWGERDVVDIGQPVEGPPTVTPGEGTETGAHPLVINPFINYQVGKGWYVASNDMQAQYSWEFGGWKVPLGVRLGYVLVKPTGSWNFYVEYATEFATDDWLGPAAESKLRANVTYVIPVVG